jgi:hypothetical protein
VRGAGELRQLQDGGRQIHGEVGCDAWWPGGPKSTSSAWITEDLTPFRLTGLTRSGCRILGEVRSDGVELRQVLTGCDKEEQTSHVPDVVMSMGIVHLPLKDVD